MSDALPETADIVTSSDDYASRFAGPVGEWMLGVQESIVASWVGRMKPRSVLDVGGGHGQLAIPLSKAGWNVTVLGSDASCSRRIQSEVDAGRIKFVVGNVISLPFPDRSFDAVISIRLLPHCGLWRELIKELCRVSSSAVIVDYPTTQGLNALAPMFFGMKKKLEGNTRAWKDFTHAEVFSEFHKQGFRLDERVGQFFLPMVFHRSLKCRAISKSVEGVCRVLDLTRRWGSPVLACFRRS
jgi:ubiquinone/menaquinone biosynthesis C-methylase UbiE